MGEEGKEIGWKRSNVTNCPSMLNFATGSACLYYNLHTLLMVQYIQLTGAINTKTQIVFSSLMLINLTT